MVPKEASSGRIQNSDASLSNNIPKTEEETSTSPSTLDNSDDSLHEWVPSENSPSSEMDEDYSSSLSCVMTPKSSSDSEDISSSSSFVVSDPKTDDEVKTSNKRNASLSPSPPIRNLTFCNVLWLLINCLNSNQLPAVQLTRI